jgi:tRNASer (uridine44-2'-O)-methyltransferase
MPRASDLPLAAAVQRTQVESLAEGTGAPDQPPRRIISAVGAETPCSHERGAVDAGPIDMSAGKNDPKEWHPVDMANAMGGGLTREWTYVLRNVAPYSRDTFARVSLELVFHPERNSKNIRRGDILSDSCDCGEEWLAGMICTRVIRRRLMPRNPNVDNELVQTCSFHAKGQDPPTLVIYRSECTEKGNLPYYVPAVRAVAFEFSDGNVYLAYLPFPGTEIDERLQRVALNLLRTIHRHWYGCIVADVDDSVGTEEGYQKRVHHDLLVDKSSFQDLYIELKNKYARTLIDNWAETTDPLKHVFEDLSLAAFLIRLWDDQGLQTPFVDLGCGNGILVYILTMEGYHGYGIDVRKRKSWTSFPEQVRSCLREQILLPQFLSPASCENAHCGKFPPGTFIISNHSDELTPYTPLIAGLIPHGGFIAIPCCEYDFSAAKINHMRRPGSDKPQGRYATYCAWISDITKAMGWVVEREMLRIPSTRNVAIIGRRRESAEAADWALALRVIREFGGHNGYHGFVERAMGLKDKVHRRH